MAPDIPGRSRLNSSIRPGSVTPKTARMITSSVTVCATVRVRILSPGRQLSISRFVISSISSAKPAIASPWNGGSISFRMRKWRSPSRSRIDSGPVTAAMI